MFNICITNKIFCNNPINIVLEPSDKNFYVGYKAEIKVEANSPSQLNYKWYKDNQELLNGDRIKGVDTEKLIIEVVELNDFGQYKCIIWNDTDSITSRTATITVSIDNTPPFFNGYSPNYIFYTNTNERYATISLPEIIASDNVDDSVSIKQLSGVKNNENLIVGTYNFIYEASDKVGNKSILSFNVSVVDNQTPQLLTFPNDTTIILEAGNCTAEVNINNPTFLDNSINYNDNIKPGDLLFTAYRSDNPDTIAFVFLRNIKSGTKIGFTDKGWLSAGGFRANETVIYWEATEDISIGKEIWISGLITNSGLVTGVALDLSASGDQVFAFRGDLPTEGNTSNFIAGIQMNSTSGSSDLMWDSEASDNFASTRPSAIMTGFNSLRISPERDNAVYTGNRTGNLIEIREHLNNPNNWLKSDNPISSSLLGDFEITTINYQKENGSSNIFPTGNNQIKYTIEDLSNNKIEHICNIIVKDTLKPFIEQLPDTTVYCDLGKSYTKVNYRTPLTSDDCSGVSLQVIEGLNSGSNFSFGIHNIKYEAKDASGNSSLSSFNIIVIDNQPPVFNEINNYEIVLSGEETETIVNYTLPTATDNCGDVSIELVSGKGTGASFGVGEYWEIYKATDNSGNTVLCSLKIIIIYNNSPVINYINLQEMLEDSILEIPISFTDQDEEDSHIISATTNNNKLSLSVINLTATTAILRIIPEENYFGKAIITLKVEDSKGTINSVDVFSFEINIINVNDSPSLIKKNSVKLNENETIVIDDSNLYAVDIDNSINEIKYKITKLPSYGLLKKNNIPILLNEYFTQQDLKNKVVSYTHIQLDSLKDKMFFQLMDKSDIGYEGYLDFNITLVNKPPKFIKKPYLEFYEDIEYKVTKNFILSLIKDDSPLDSINFSLTNSQNVKVLTRERKNYLLGNTNWFGVDSLLLKINDGEFTIEEYIILNILPVNDPPEIKNIPEKIIFDNSSYAEINLWIFIQDVDTPDSLLNVKIFSMNDNIIATYNNKTGDLKIGAKKGFAGEGVIKIIVTDLDGSEVSSELKVKVNNLMSIDTEKITYELRQNYPNPFNSNTIIEYSVQNEGIVIMDLLNILGEQVQNLTSEFHRVGNYKIILNMNHNPSGVYYCKIVTGNYKKTIKLIYLK